MSDMVSLFRTFLRVVERGSFTAVADERATSQPTISRQIAALEAHLGCILFQRSTRSLTLTDDGRTFYVRARQAVDTMAEAETSVGRHQGMPTGTLKLSSAVVMGRLHIMPRLPRFLSLYPDLAVDFTLSDDFIDLTEEGVDLAIRVGQLTDPSLIARRIGLTRRIVVATPDYLDRHGEPHVPDDLVQHDCILYSGLASGVNWRFTGKDGPVSVPVTGRCRVNNTEALRAAILNGLGIGIAPIWHFVDGEIETGRLKVLLPEYPPEAHPIHAVYTTKRFLAPKIRAMIDYLAVDLAKDPSLNPAP